MSRVRIVLVLAAFAALLRAQEYTDYKSYDLPDCVVSVLSHRDIHI
jgi:hypothetical protein